MSGFRRFLIYGHIRQVGIQGSMLWFCILTSCLLVAGYALCSLYSGNAKVGFAGAPFMAIRHGGSRCSTPHGRLPAAVAELLLIHLGPDANSPLVLRSATVVRLSDQLSRILLLTWDSIVAGIYVFCSFLHFKVGSLTAPHAGIHAPGECLSWHCFFLSTAALFLRHHNRGTAGSIPNKHIDASKHRPAQPGAGMDAAAINQRAWNRFTRRPRILLMIEIVQHSEIYLHELLLIALCTWSAASHSRLIFAFGIIVAPILSRLLSNAWDNYNPQQDRSLPNAVMMLAALLICFFAFPDKQNLTNQVVENSPAKAVEFIKTSQLSGNMLNDYLYGGYLIWAAPEHPVFVDGRSDVFEWTGVLEEFGDWATLQAAPRKLLDKYNIKFCVLTNQSPMVHVLPLLPEWKRAYSDNNSVVFVRTPISVQSK